jgi:choline dehydrogenase
VVIVGAGAAGGVLADRLSADPARSVLLLEAGPDFGPRAQDQPDEIIDVNDLSGTSFDWSHTSEPGADGRRLPLSAGRVVGGSSATNNAMALRGRPADYDAWARLGNPGLGFADLLPYFRSVERDLDFASAWHGGDGPLPINRPRPAAWTPVQRAFMEACAAAGHPTVADHNAPDAYGAGPMPFNQLAGIKQSAALTFLARARQRPNLTLRADAPVDRIPLEHGRAVGVVLASGETVHGDLIVLAAGAYGSPLLLLRSGIGPADDLREAGIEPRIDAPGVGSGLQDHPLLRLAFTAAAPEAIPPLQTMLTCATDGGTDPDLQIFPAGPTATDGAASCHLAVAMVHPRSRGSVRLVADGNAARPAIDPRLLDDPEDLARMVTGIRLADAIADTAPLSSLLTPRQSTRAASDRDLAAFALAETASYQHPVGTCRMGPEDEPSAVTDTGGAVRGVDRLHVADASTMPRIPRANTHLPTLMLAERFAAVLAGR